MLPKIFSLYILYQVSEKRISRRIPARGIVHAAVLIAVVVTALFTNACSSSSNQSPRISSLKSTTPQLYPKGSAELECIASDPQGGTLTFTWSCAEGTFTGSGPIVTWQAPNAYGDFHIMVIVQDSSGNSSQATITIGVISNDNQKDCDTCPARR